MPLCYHNQIVKELQDPPVRTGWSHRQLDRGQVPSHAKATGEPIPNPTVPYRRHLATGETTNIQITETFVKGQNASEKKYFRQGECPL